MNNQDNIKNNIHAVKDALGLTLKNIGASTGVTDATVSRYISGIMEITDEWAEKFCEAYHVDIEWLRSGSSCKCQALFYIDGKFILPRTFGVTLCTMHCILVFTGKDCVNVRSETLSYQG